MNAIHFCQIVIFCVLQIFLFAASSCLSGIDLSTLFFDGLLDCREYTMHNVFTARKSLTHRGSDGKQLHLVDICVEFLSHNIIPLQLVKIGILLMLSFVDD